MIIKIRMTKLVGKTRKYLGKAGKKKKKVKCIYHSGCTG